MKRIAIIIVLLFLVMLIFFLTGPKAPAPQIKATVHDTIIPIAEVETYLQIKEKRVRNIKPDNGSRIVWNDPVNKTKTEYVVVYLHGFSASQGEGIPVHSEFAKRYGCNLLLSRLSDHGIVEEEPMLKLTPERLVASAVEAVRTGKLLGDKVILMSTSTGGTLSLLLAAENPSIHSLILYSPNIDLSDSKSALLLFPWGLQIARVVVGGKYYEFQGSEKVRQYWTTKYSVESLVALKSLVKATMTPETFRKIKQPVFTGYYYKNEKEQDKLVSVNKMKEMHNLLATPAAYKHIVNFPNAGNHAIASQFWSKDIENVKKATYKFAEEVLKLQQVK